MAGMQAGSLLCFLEKTFQDFARLIETDNNEGKIVVPDAAEVPIETVTQAIGESLAN